MNRENNKLSRDIHKKTDSEKQNRKNYSFEKRANKEKTGVKETKEKDLMPTPPHFPLSALILAMIYAL